MVLSDLDRSLVNRCLDGADGAWEDFIERYLPLISHVVNSSATQRNGQIAPQARDDLIAEVLLRIVENDFAVLKRFRGQSSLGTYLVVIARRIALNTLDRPPTANLVAAQKVANQDDGQLHIEDVEQVETLLAKLPKNEAAAIRMFHLEHRSYGDIGSSIGIPANSVGPLLSKARRRMRAMS